MPHNLGHPALTVSETQSYSFFIDLHQFSLSTHLVPSSANSKWSYNSIIPIFQLRKNFVSSIAKDVQMHKYSLFLMYRIAPFLDVLTFASLPHKTNLLPAPPASYNLVHAASSLHWRLASDRFGKVSPLFGEHQAPAFIS